MLYNREPPAGGRTAKDVLDDQRALDGYGIYPSACRVLHLQASDARLLPEQRKAFVALKGVSEAKVAQT